MHVAHIFAHGSSHSVRWGCLAFDIVPASEVWGIVYPFCDRDGLVEIHGGGHGEEVDVGNGRIGWAIGVDRGVSHERYSELWSISNE